MDSMPRRLILLVAGSALLLAPLLTIQLATGAGRAHACSCRPNPPPLEALDGSAAVFSGKVVSSGTFSFEHYWSVEIEVDTVWKGPVTSTTFVYTTYGPTCGYEWFERGKDFLVYAYEGYESDETLYASLCSRTRPFEYAEEDLQELGDGWAPDTGAGPRSGAGLRPSRATPESGRRITVWAGITASIWPTSPVAGGAPPGRG